MKAIRVFEFAAEGIGCIVWSLRHDQHGVASARHELFDKLIFFQSAFDVVLPAVKVNDKINLAGFAEAMRNENSNSVVRVMFRGRKELVLVFVAFSALRVGKWSAGKMDQKQLA